MSFWFNFIGIVNKSSSCGCFPNCFRIARVIPLHKAGDTRDVSNYRPISLLLIFSKILEEVVSYQLCNHFKILKLFDSSQSGFRKQLSTSLAIVDPMQYVYDNLDRVNTEISFFLDFSKAFDCVDHDLLLEKKIV